MRYKIRVKGFSKPLHLELRESWRLVGDVLFYLEWEAQQTHAQARLPFVYMPVQYTPTDPLTNTEPLVRDYSTREVCVHTSK